MKKFGICLFAFLLFASNIKADGVKIDYKKEKEGYVLEYKLDDKVFSFKEAKEQFGIDDYLVIPIDEEAHYFYQGKEIKKEVYDKGIIVYEADKRCDLLKEACKRVHTTEEVKKALDEIMKNDEVVEKHLIYSKEEYEHIDFDEVMKYFKEHYLTPMEKNMFTYKEYGKVHPIKTLPNYNEEELVVNGLIKKTTAEEEQKIDTFMESFLPLFKDKTDYEKILGVYTYISNQASYVKDNGYENFLDAYLSPYDVFIEKKSVCIGNATAFQYAMEKLGIESYIVDHVTSKKSDSYSTNHTYNLVSLDKKWYLIDITEKSLDGFLLEYNDLKATNELSLYYDIDLATSSYFENHPDAKKEFSIDYEALDKVILKIKGEEKKEEQVKEEQKKENPKESELEYFLLSGILLILFVVIFLFTRKK